MRELQMKDRLRLHDLLQGLLDFQFRLKNVEKNKTSCKIWGSAFPEAGFKRCLLESVQPNRPGYSESFYHIPSVLGIFGVVLGAFDKILGVLGWKSLWCVEGWPKITFFHVGDFLWKTNKLLTTQKIMGIFWKSVSGNFGFWWDQLSTIKQKMVSRIFELSTVSWHEVPAKATTKSNVGV